MCSNGRGSKVEHAKYFDVQGVKTKHSFIRRVTFVELSENFNSNGVVVIFLEGSHPFHTRYLNG